jgi:hypothetical protein
MTHPLVDQLRFARSEFQRGLDSVNDADSRHRFLPMNCISWMVGHLAHQEQLYWLVRGQAKELAVPELKAYGYGEPASTPPLAEMWAGYQAVMTAVDPWLDTLVTNDLTSFMVIKGKTHDENVGSMIRRVTYHIFFHTGESQAIRQLLGHTGLGVFIGDIQAQGPYRPE